jgi:cell shape-determining protein MreC
MEGITNMEICSLKDIIAALNQKLKKTEDLEQEIIKVRDSLKKSNEGR